MAMKTPFEKKKKQAAIFEKQKNFPYLRSYATSKNSDAILTYGKNIFVDVRLPRHDRHGSICR